MARKLHLCIKYYDYINLLLELLLKAPHMLGKVQDTMGIAILIIVPGNKFHELVIESNTGLGIEDGRVGVPDKVS